MTTTRSWSASPITGVVVEGALGRTVVTWRPEPWEVPVDHYAVYAAQGREVPVEDSTLLARTVYPRFQHDGLGPQASTWTYRVVTVAASGWTSRPSVPVTATTTASVVVSGVPVAVVGAFDGRNAELALSPRGYPQYLASFPGGADVRADDPGAAAGWPYLQPGPQDTWAGSAASTFRLRFRLEEVPATDLDVAIWLVDTHGRYPGTLVVGVGGTRIAEVAMPAGASRGSVEGDVSAPGTRLRPYRLELPLPRTLLTAGENVLEITKNSGSWIAYDAVGVFARD